MIEYFKHNLDGITKAKPLEKFDSSQIPILEDHGDVRLEQITPTPKREVRKERVNFLVAREERKQEG